MMIVKRMIERIEYRREETELMACDEVCTSRMEEKEKEEENVKKRMDMDRNRVEYVNKKENRIKERSREE